MTRPSKVKISLEDNRLVVATRCAGWAIAASIFLRNRELPPEGYKLVQAKVKTRSGSGAACNLDMLFIHCDSRVPPFTEDEAYEFFRREEPGTVSGPWATYEND